MQNRFGLLTLDMMPIYMIIALDIIIIILSSINCPIVICLPTVCYVFEREDSSENYNHRVYFYHIIKTKNALLQFYTFNLIFIFLV